MSINCGNALCTNLIVGDGSTSLYNYILERSFNGLITNNANTTIFTITKTGASDYVTGFVEIFMVGGTNNAGNGSRYSKWWIQQLNTSFTTGQVETFTGGTYPPTININVSGNTFQLQGRGSTSSPLGNDFGGTYYVKVWAPRGLLVASNNMWSIS